VTPGIHFSSIWAKHVLGLPWASFFAIFSNTFSRRHFKCLFHVVFHCFAANLYMNVHIFPTPCVTSSLSYFWYRADDLFMLFPFGRPYGTGGISAWFPPILRGLPPPPRIAIGLSWPWAPFSITFSNTLPRHRF